MLAMRHVHTCRARLTCVAKFDAGAPSQSHHATIVWQRKNNGDTTTELNTKDGQDGHRQIKCT